MSYLQSDIQTGKKSQARDNPTYQAFVTLQPDWFPFNSLGAQVSQINDNIKQAKFQTCLTYFHYPSCNKQAHTFILPNFLLYSHQNATQVTQNLGNFQIQT